MVNASFAAPQDPLKASQTGKNQDAIGQKWDTGKAPVFQGFLKYFPRAVAAVAMVSQAGANKYAGGKFPTKWREVPDGENRYADAQARHMLEEAKGNLIDDGVGGTNCLHLAQEAWNNLARLELFLMEQEAINQPISIEQIKEALTKVEPLPVSQPVERRVGAERRVQCTFTALARRGDQRRKG